MQMIREKERFLNKKEKEEGAQGKLPFFFLVTETEEGGVRRRLAGGPWATAAGMGEGKTERRVRRFDSLPRLGQRWSEAAWP